MKAVLAGAFGNLGSDVLKSLIRENYELTAADMTEHDIGLKGSYTFKAIDVTKPKTLKGLCDGAEIIISTVGLTKASAVCDSFDIDYRGNLNLLNEAKAAGVKKFIYISVLKAEMAPKVPMLRAKYLFEEELKKSGLDYIIYRPTGYFYDIIKVFRPMIQKGEVTLLGKKAVHANVVDTPDFADYIVGHIGDKNITVSIGGKETYSYEEIAKMCFAAAGKDALIKRAPVFLFDMLAFINKCKKSGKEDIIRFSKWTLTQEMVSDTECGDASFKEYIKNNF